MEPPSTGKTPSWRDVVLPQLRQRNEAAAAFHPVVLAHMGLVVESARLRTQVQGLERQTIILRHEAAERGREAGDGALNKKVSSLQEELNEALRRNTALMEEKSDLYSTRAALRDQVDSLRSELAKATARTTELEGEHDGLKMDRDDAMTQLKVIREEHERAQQLVRSLQDTNAKLKEENAGFVTRILEEKLKAADEINRMNGLLERQERQLKILRSGGAGSGSGGSASAGAGSEPLLPKSPSTAVGGIPTRRRHDIRAHSTEINSCVFSESGGIVATASSDGTVKLWDSVTGKGRATLRGSSSDQPFMCVDLRGGLAVGGCNDRVVRLWDISTERVQRTLAGHAGKVYAAYFMPDQRSLVTAGTDRTIKLWDLNKGNCVRTLHSTSIVNSVGVNADGLMVASGHQDKAVRLWDIRKGAKLAENKEAHSAAVTSVTFSPGGGAAPHLLTACRDNFMRVMDGCSLAEISKLSADTFHVRFNWTGACYSPSGSYAACGSADGSVVVWDTDSQAAKERLASKSSAPVSCATWSPDGRRIAASSGDGRLTVWE